MKTIRLVKIPNMSEDEYNRIIDAIDETIPFAVVDARYNPRLKAGIFNFWDTDYIPEELKKFIVQPPLSRENREKMSRMLKEAVKGGQ